MHTFGFATRHLALSEMSTPTPGRARGPPAPDLRPATQTPENRAAVDDLLAPDDKPTIGLLLCRSKNNVAAEYALRSSTMPIGIAEWTTAITTHFPDELTATLPRIENVEAALDTTRPGEV